jgi:hypothetical protein
MDVRTVARWLADMRPAGECCGLSFWTFRKYIDAFVPSLRAQVASVRQAASQRSRKTRAVLKGFDEVQLPDPVPLEPPTHRASRVVTKAVREMEANTALRYAFVTQMERVEESIATATPCVAILRAPSRWVNSFEIKWSESHVKNRRNDR